MRMVCSIVANDVIFILVVLVNLSPTPITALKLPPEFDRCKPDDPDLNSCLRASIEKSMRLLKDGIPSFHLLPIDPLDVTRITIQEAPNRPVSLSLDLTNIKLYGLKDAQITNVKADLKKMRLEVEAYVPSMTFNSDYELDGKFLLLPLKGKGKALFKQHDLEVMFIIQAEPETKNGNIHWKILKYDFKIVNISKLNTQLDNLFNGDQSLAKPTLEVLNTNWKEFWAELKPSIDEAFSVIFEHITDIILSKVPEKDMFL